ncbi:putative portal protein [Lactococcus phage P1046]|uniref:Putative portal protein n=1 Tax=Lactococcus phage P1046 TaxID=2662294 RepID=A0A649V1L4_9CAUD|nr:putative portal protein [Lactococcus phage P1046]
MASSDRLLHSWNAFQSNQNQNTNDFLTPSNGMTSFGGYYGRGQSNYSRSYSYNKADLIKSVITRIALDASMVDFKHLKIDPISGNQTPIPSGLINVLTRSANIDQTGRSFVFDLLYSLLDEGQIAMVPIDTTVDPNSGSFDINTARVGKIMQFFPRQVMVRVWNDNTGLEQDLLVSKENCIIIESPFYAILNDTNQTLRMLEQKIKLMNSQDNRASSGKLNGFIQFPYSTKSTARAAQAARRKQEIENEMANNKYGVASLDAHEKFVSAGMGLQNNLLSDVRQLQQDFYNQMGITEAILNGTANEQQTLGYYNRCVDVLLQYVTDAISRIALTKTAVSQGQVLVYYRNPFKLVPVEQLATVADVLTRNAIYSPNEIRELTGKAPHPNPLANELFNRNIADGNQVGGINTPGQITSDQPATASTDPLNNVSTSAIENGSLTDGGSY